MTPQKPIAMSSSVHDPYDPPSIMPISVQLPEPSVNPRILQTIPSAPERVVNEVDPSSHTQLQTL